MSSRAKTSLREDAETASNGKLEGTIVKKRCNYPEFPGTSFVADDDSYCLGDRDSQDIELVSSERFP